MKNLSLVLLGAGLSALAFLSSSARVTAAPPAQGGLRGGTTLFGLNLVAGTGQPLAGLGANTPVKIRERSGDWFLIDFPSMKSGPTWVNVANVVSYRTDR